MPDKTTLTRLFDTATQAVRGDTSVGTALKSIDEPAPDQIIAVGKASSPMAAAALAHFDNKVPTLVVTKHDHLTDLPSHVHTIESAHPVPDQNSLTAGQRLIETVENCAEGSRLLMLVSGGASALAEHPKHPMSLTEIASFNDTLLASGLDIHAMNEQRRAMSALKGGNLLARFKGARVTTLAVSDVEGDDLNVIGSGIGNAPENPAFDFHPHIVASNAVARAAIASAHPVATNSETLYGDINDIAAHIAKTATTKGLHLFGGEPTTILPPNPGKGGRNQALALTLANHIEGQDDVTILVGGTDGTDGPTTAAGAIVDGTTWGTGAQEALDRADSGTYLDAKDALLVTGPTGTNVMDLVLVLRT